MGASASSGMIRYVRQEEEEAPAPALEEAEELMDKLTKHNSKRAMLVNQMNEAAGNYETASKRVEKARKVLAAVEEAVADKEREIRAEVEALFNEKMAEVNKGLYAAKSELGTALKMRAKFGETYVQARDQLAKCLPELPEEEAVRVATERDQPGPYDHEHPAL